MMVQWRSGNAVVCKTSMHGFDSRLHLQKNNLLGWRNLVYAQDLKSWASNGLRVQVPPRAPIKKHLIKRCFFISLVSKLLFGFVFRGLSHFRRSFFNLVCNSFRWSFFDCSFILSLSLSSTFSLLRSLS